MRIGLTFPYELGPRAAAAALRSGEKAGLSSVWLYENLYGPGVFASAGFAAGVMDTAEVAVGTTSPFARSPGALAMESAKLQHLTGGRFTLGLAAANPRLIEGMGATPGRPLAAMADTLRIVREVTSGGTSQQDGRFVTRDLELMWRPTHGPPSLMVGTLRPKMMAVAAALADGLIISCHAPVSVVQETIAAFRTAWNQAGRDGQPRFTAYALFAFGSDEREAIEQLRPRLAAAIVRLPVDPTIGELLEAGGCLSRDDAGRLAVHLAANPDQIDVIPDDVIVTHAIAATPHTCAATFARFADAGVDDLVLFEMTQFPGFRAALDYLATMGLGDR